MAQIQTAVNLHCLFRVLSWLQDDDLSVEKLLVCRLGSCSVMKWSSQLQVSGQWVLRAQEVNPYVCSSLK